MSPKKNINRNAVCQKFNETIDQTKKKNQPLIICGDGAGFHNSLEAARFIGNNLTNLRQ